MSPLAALTAILMGSAVAITTGLLMVLAVYGILGSDYPRLMAEIPSLLRSLELFGVLGGGLHWGGTVPPLALVCPSGYLRLDCRHCFGLLAYPLLMPGFPVHPWSGAVMR